MVPVRPWRVVRRVVSPRRRRLGWDRGWWTVPWLSPGRALCYQRRRGSLRVRTYGWTLNNTARTFTSSTTRTAAAGRRATARAAGAGGALCRCSTLTTGTAVAAAAAGCSSTGSSAVLLIPSVVDNSALVPEKKINFISFISFLWKQSRKKPILIDKIDKFFIVVRTRSLKCRYVRVCRWL